MPKVLENVITGALANASDRTVTLTWKNGATTVNRFGDLVGEGVSAPLNDPSFFANVRVGENGRSLEWPGDMDFSADALWFEIHPQAPQQAPNRTVDTIQGATF